MRILITLTRFTLGGSETYSVTVAEQLERLGHSATLYAAEASPEGRELAASRGLRLVIGDLGSLEDCDAVLAQDAASAYLVADRRPGLPLVFTLHGFAAFEHPPGGLRPSPKVVVLNDRTARRVAAIASGPEIVRLRQPIDIERFRPRGAGRPQARRVLVLSNKLDSARRDMLETVCDDLGLELVRLGSSGTPTLAPEAELTDADIVVGYGRSVLEGMAMGRAAYVWDYAGGDGWVTPETYPALEADGFCGAATEDIIDADRLRADFAAYRPELGALSFDLVRKHHSANEHTQAIVELLASGAEAASDGAPDTLETLGLLVRAESRAAIRAGDLEFENKQLWGRLQALEARAGAAEGEAAAEEARADGAQEQLAALLRSRSWRMTEPMRRLIGLLRRR